MYRSVFAIFINDGCRYKRHDYILLVTEDITSFHYFLTNFFNIDNVVILNPLRREIIMAESKSIQELAADYVNTYALVAPHEKALTDRVREAAVFYRAFVSEHGWYSGSRFSFLSNPYTLHIAAGNVSVDDGHIWFDTDDGEDAYFTFDEIDNFAATLQKEYDEYMSVRNAEAEQFRAQKIENLERELAAARSGE